MYEHLAQMCHTFEVWHIYICIRDKLPDHNLQSVAHLSALPDKPSDSTLNRQNILHNTLNLHYQ
jgi:hypothetical protein